jgi:hypothetical protein
MITVFVVSGAIGIAGILLSARRPRDPLAPVE